VRRIHLCNQAKKGKLVHCPPLRPPNLLQTNRVVTTIVDIVNPVFRFTVARERLGVLKALPLPIDFPVSWVVLDHLNHAVS
jgi:hypothetical protein